MDEGKSVVTARQRRGAVSLLLAMVLLGVFPLDVLLPSFPALAAHFGRPRRTSRCRSVCSPWAFRVCSIA
jgi:hypothetical protein